MPFRPKQAESRLWQHFHAYRRRYASETGGAALPQDAIVERLMRAEDPDWLHHRYVIFDGAQIVSHADLRVARPDSPDFEARRRAIQIEMAVLPAWRRLQIGSNWLDLALEAMDLHGAEELVGSLESKAGLAFARAIGAQFFESELELHGEVGLNDLDRWRGANRAPRRLGLTWEHIEGQPSQAWQAALDAFSQRFGPRDAEGCVWRAPAHAQRQAGIKLAGGRYHALVLIGPRDSLIGLIEGLWWPHAPERASLLEPLVTPAWQGRGLEAALCREMIAQLLERQSGLRWIDARVPAPPWSPSAALLRGLGFETAGQVRLARIGRDGLLRYLDAITTGPVDAG